MDKALIDYIHQIERNNQAGCFSIMERYYGRINQSPGSLQKHQNWKGGYVHHLEETMMIANELYLTLSKIRQLDFSISDVILVLFLHDLEKPFKYVEPIRGFGNDDEKYKFIIEMSQDHNIKLSDIHLNAIRYIHGEGKDHNSDTRIQLPLAAFAHMCDVTSARIWFDYPK